MEDDFELPLGASLDQKMDLLLSVNLDLRKTLAGTVRQLEMVSVKVESHENRIGDLEKKLQIYVIHVTRICKRNRAKKLEVVLRPCTSVSGCCF